MVVVHYLNGSLLGGNTKGWTIKIHRTRRGGENEKREKNSKIQEDDDDDDDAK